MNDIPYIEDLIDQVNRVFEHGHSRAKNHDQRLGQWIVNKLRTTGRNNNDIVRYLFSIENKEFLELIGDYND